MLALRPAKSFKRDIRLIATRGWNIMKIFPQLLTLLNGHPLPRQYDDHTLKGKWTGYKEFHIEPDWIVIYRIDDSTLILERTGTHDDLFK